jgi:hypothetical protein
MTPHRSQLCLLLIILVSACASGGPVEAPESPPVATAEPTCPFVGFALNEQDVPLSGLRVTCRATKRVDERRWQGSGEETQQAGPDGRFECKVDCGSSLGLDFDGWTWPIEPDHLMVEQGMAPMTLHLIPDRKVLLRLESSPGRRIEGTFARRASPGLPAATLPVPVSGLQIDGVSWGRVEGDLMVEGAAPRPWVLARSHELAEVAPNRFEAVVEMGPEAPVWLVTPPSVLRQIQGVWCVSDVGRGGPCKRQRGAWLCSCKGAPALVLTSDLWSAAMLLRVEGAQVALSELPAATQQCFSSSSPTTYQVLPPGLSVDPLVAVDIALSESQPKICLELPAGENFELTGPTGSHSFVVGGGDISLPWSR